MPYDGKHISYFWRSFVLALHGCLAIPVTRCINHYIATAYWTAYRNSSSANPYWKQALSSCIPYYDLHYFCTHTFGNSSTPMSSAMLDQTLPWFHCIQETSLNADPLLSAFCRRACRKLWQKQQQKMFALISSRAPAPWCWLEICFNCVLLHSKCQ